MFLPVLILCFSLQPASAQIDPQSEHKFKAVYLYNFLKFVVWPDGAFADRSSPVRIGILGNDLLKKLLEQTVGSEMIGDRPIAVTQISSLDEVESCQLVFVSRSERESYREILAKVKGRPILEMRARYEHVDQDGLARSAEAYTLRTRLGWETAAFHGFKALVEMEDVRPLAAVRYNVAVPGVAGASLNGKTEYPIVTIRR